MKKQWFALTAVGLAWAAVALVLVCGGDLAGREYVPGQAWAAGPEAEPSITEVEPLSAPNDLDTPIVIVGAGFEAGAAVWLDGASLADVAWPSAARLEATVPWGMGPGVYTVTVVNPGGESGLLTDAFTVTQGIGEWNAGGLYGGEIEQVVLNPITPTTVYAVADKVGIFRSRDGGEAWSLVHAPNANDLAIDPVHPEILYWGTGGFYRSDDEVDSWHYLDDVVNQPFPHPSLSGTLYATKRWDFGGGGGLWKSTDYGQTWVTATNGLTDTAVTGLVFHPTNPVTMYLGTAHGHVFRSADAGDSWSHVAKPINYILTLAINPRGAHELWVSNFCLDVPNLTLKSTNADHTEWVTVGAPVGETPLESIDFPPLAWGDAYSETVFVQACFIGTYRTMDNGDTWEELLLGAGSVNDLTLHPTASDTLYGAGRFDGVLKSEDGGETFRWISQGISALYPLQMATVPGQPDVVYAVVDREGGIYKGTQGAADWQFLDLVEANLHSRFAVVCVDPFIPTRVYSAGDAPSHLGNGWWVHISEDSGQTWPIYSFVAAPEPYSDCNAIGPLVLRADPTKPGALLAGVDHVRFGDPLFSAGGIYRSTDYGEEWSYIDVGQHISAVTDLAYDALTPTIAYAATGWKGGGTGMLRSTDSGQSWQPMGQGVAALDHVESIAAEPRAPYRLFVWTHSDGLYLSEDHGGSWVGGNAQPGYDVELLCTDEVPPVLYAGTSHGLHRSMDGAQTWERAAGVVGWVPIYSLATAGEGERVLLYAGTTGGYVEGGAAGALSQMNAEGTLVDAGVYRYTTLRPWWRVYLPLVLRVSG
jgi:photosystem II stability/assembly factor-like uncharacterized protein